DEDKEGKVVDPSHYHGMIGTLLYLTASRPDLQSAICMCARYQAWPIEKHVHVVKRIFRYLRGTVNRGLWYPNDSSVALTTFADADHAGCQDTRCSTSGSLQFLGERLISWSSKGKRVLQYPVQKLNTSPYLYQFIKEQVENGVIELYFVNTKYQLANLFTKALGRDGIEFLINKLGMRSFTPETLKQLTDEKYGYESCDPVDTIMVEKSKLNEDKEGKAGDLSHYHGMIGTLLYLTTSRLDLQFAICMCARYQARPTEKHDSSVALTTFADASHASFQDTRHSTSGSLQFLRERLISWSSNRQKSAAISSTEAGYISLSGCCA
nr:hypothetical protein [Tanacetum cinerariifolium]